MNCLKCGRETDQTFCEECREIMGKYPVNPGTIVQLPKGRTPKKTTSRRMPISLEEKIGRQSKMIRRLLILTAVLLIVNGVLGTMLYRIWKEPHSRPKGQNYSTVAKPTEEAAVETDEK